MKKARKKDVRINVIMTVAADYSKNVKAKDETGDNSLGDTFSRFTLLIASFSMILMSLSIMQNALPAIGGSLFLENVIVFSSFFLTIAIVFTTIYMMSQKK